MPILHRASASFASGALFAAACALLAPAPPADLQAQARPEPAPPAVRQDWKERVGTWIADNAKYKSEADPFDAFGIEWRWALGEQGLVGRLYGVQNGKEAGTFWEFRELWHPTDRTVVVMQFGRGGEYGVGTAQRKPDGSEELLQTLYDPEQGTVTKIGHRGHRRGGVNTGTSYVVSDAGNWKPRRTYVWRRQR